MKQLRFGVVGLGVGERHAAAYNALPGAEVAAVCDTDPEKLKTVSDRQGVGGRYTDFRKMIEAESLDAVSICSYDDDHADQVVQAFQAGLHVMVEKPLALNRAALAEIIRAQQDAGKILTSNLILRQSPRFIRLKERVAAGAFGDLHYIEGDYLHQILWKITEGWRGKMDFYCVTYGGGIHLIDLMRWIAGEEITQVTAMATKKLTRDSTFAYPDTMASLLRFESDLLGKSTTSFGTQRPIMHTLNLYGTEGSFENGVPDATEFRGDGADDRRTVTDPYPAIEKGDLLPGFVRAIRDGTDAPVAARDVYRVMEVCFACWESVQQGRMVDVSYTL